MPVLLTSFGVRTALLFCLCFLCHVNACSLSPHIIHDVIFYCPVCTLCTVYTVLYSVLFTVSWCQCLFALTSYPIFMIFCLPTESGGADPFFSDDDCASGDSSQNGEEDSDDGAETEQEADGDDFNSFINSQSGGGGQTSNPIGVDELVLERRPEGSSRAGAAAVAPTSMQWAIRTLPKVGRAGGLTGGGGPSGGRGGFIYIDPNSRSRSSASAVAAAVGAGSGSSAGGIASGIAAAAAAAAVSIMILTAVVCNAKHSKRHNRNRHGRDGQWLASCCVGLDLKCLGHNLFVIAQSVTS